LQAGLEYLLRLVESDGPDVTDYQAVDAAFKSIMDAKRAGRATTEQLREAWIQLGIAFGADTMQGHGVRKPYGYSGDFEMIDRIYLRSIAEDPKIRRWDEYFQSRDACEAVRNRKLYFKNLIAIMLEQFCEGIRILNIGSGPARDVYESLSDQSVGKRLQFDCVDMDENAIAYASKLCISNMNEITFHASNIFKWRSTNVYELIWSAGLFDYLDDSAFVLLIRRIALMLNKNGRLVVGNFSPNNPTRDYMEFGEWCLNYRNKEKLLDLAGICDIEDTNYWVEEEPKGINLFLNFQRVETS
jgi:extracellular factor (EF) 3-hydroxypalmitic acid methyl ester biosynthesis protein